jgi:acyl dehydratase
MNKSSTSFTFSPDNRYFEDYTAGSVHEFGPIAVEENEVLDFGKRFVPLSYHTDPEAAKESIYGGLIASGWHTAALMMRLYTDHYLSKVPISVRRAAMSCVGANPSFRGTNYPSE